MPPGTFWRLARREPISWIAARLMTLGAQNMQAAEFHHFVMFFQDLRLDLTVNRVPFRAIFVVDGVGVFIFLTQTLAREEVGVAAQQCLVRGWPYSSKPSYALRPVRATIEVCACGSGV